MTLYLDRIVETVILYIGPTITSSILSVTELCISLCNVISVSQEVFEHAQSPQSISMLKTHSG